VDIQKYDLAAQYQYATVPKLDPDAFLMAKVVGWESLSLLPGETNVFFEGAFVGKSFIDPNNIKDTLSVSLGRDKRIVVKREKLKDFSAEKFIGSNKRETRAFEISVRNTKTSSVEIILEDHIPVSRNNQLEVTLQDGGGARFDPVTGRLAWTLTIPPGESRKLVYKYEVKYPKDRIISPLE